VVLGADEAAADDQRTRGPHDAQRAPEHPELAVIGNRAGLDLELDLSAHPALELVIEADSLDTKQKQRDKHRSLLVALRDTNQTEPADADCE
jgi:hypothetical protein